MCVLCSVTVDDQPFEMILKKVPFNIEEKSSGEMFAYSGECNTGCVYTQIAKKLLWELNGAWLLHEYAHVLHMAVPMSAQAKAVNVAYCNFKANVLDPLTKKRSLNRQPYGAANYAEYFACLTEGFVDPPSGIRVWPLSNAQLKEDDPTG